nr:hypothetical protein [Oscillibacter sp. CU971]
MAKPPNKNMEPMHTSSISTVYFPYFRTRRPGRCFLFFEQGDLTQKILRKPEGAQPAADEAPQQTPEGEEKPKSGEGYLKASLVQQGL